MKVSQDTQQDQLLIQLLVLLEQPNTSAAELPRLLRQHRKLNGQLFSKDELVEAYRRLAGTGSLQPFSEHVLRKIRRKPIRTASGVAPVTVLTKPFPCPGKCIFCPSDVRMPKSYLADEPGAQRAERNYFDPYLQTYNRLLALHLNGHPVEKVEIIVLGGTWSYYPEAYQIWFISECFRALNEFGSADGRTQVLDHYTQMEQSLRERQQFAPTNDPTHNKRATQPHEIAGEQPGKTYNQVVSELYVAPERLGGFAAYQQANWETLEAAQRQNEQAQSRCVGLVIETRPDNISEAEVFRIRRLGCTKAQIGFQSLQDEVLKKNKRGHTVAATRRAVKLLRQAGFKIHAHWMANLYGSSVTQDMIDFTQLFSDPDFCPDELKIYPCSLIGSAELMQYFKTGKWRPYTRQELLAVLEHCFLQTPEYCRLTRVVRDIPATDIVEGNKLTNFRQIAEQALQKKQLASRDIRAREIRNWEFEPSQAKLECVEYQTSTSTELFLQFVVPATPHHSTGHGAGTQEKLLGFLRLSLPNEQSFIPELGGAAIIREVHVYGDSERIGAQTGGRAQHLGLGTQLLESAQAHAKARGYQSLAVISAIGTRAYYRKRGFQDGLLYQSKVL